MTVLRVDISPVLNDKQYNAALNDFMTPEAGPTTIEPNVAYRSDGQLKFLLLPDALSAGACLKATVALKDAGFQKGSRRAAIAQKNARKLTVGWIAPIHPTYKNMRTAPTLEQPELLADLYPLLIEMDRLFLQNLPQEHEFAVACIPKLWRPEGEKDDLSRIKDPHHYKIVDALDPWDRTYTIRGTIFSTLELNRNIVFKAHEDGHNVKGTLGCIAALGAFAGGRLVFPRFGYSAELGPKDLLICDTNFELHGNLGPIVGERFSVVAFMHGSLLGRA